MLPTCFSFRSSFEQIIVKQRVAPTLFSFLKQRGLGGVGWGGVDGNKIQNSWGPHGFSQGNFVEHSILRSLRSLWTDFSMPFPFPFPFIYLLHFPVIHPFTHLFHSFIHTFICFILSHSFIHSLVSFFVIHSFFLSFIHKFICSIPVHSFIYVFI
jgi:hypothetical protein